MKLQLPSWLRRETLRLPPWAKRAKNQSDWASITIEADTDAYVAEWFGLLGVTKPDQYWLEVAYQCAKLDLQTAIAGTEYDPRIGGKPAEFKFNRSDKWALKLHPTGKGIKAATQGREARGHYVRIRGRMPF